jgi:uncharacterized protein (DUF1330 family)
MKTKYTIALSMIAVAALGSVAFQGLHAQTKSPVYIVNEVDVTDSAGFQKYIDSQAQLIQKHGGHYIIRGGKVVTTFDGEPPKRFTIYVFDNEDAMQAWRNDPSNKELLETRNKYGKFRSFAVEGLSK